MFGGLSSHHQRTISETKTNFVLTLTLMPGCSQKRGMEPRIWMNDTTWSSRNTTCTGNKPAPSATTPRLCSQPGLRSWIFFYRCCLTKGCTQNVFYSTFPQDQDFFFMSTVSNYTYASVVNQFCIPHGNFFPIDFVWQRVVPETSFNSTFPQD